MWSMRATRKSIIGRISWTGESKMFRRGRKLFDLRGFVVWRAELQLGRSEVFDSRASAPEAAGVKTPHLATLSSGLKSRLPNARASAEWACPETGAATKGGRGLTSAIPGRKDSWATSYPGRKRASDRTAVQARLLRV